MFVVYDKDSRHIFLEFQITNLKLRIISIHQIRQIHKKSFLATKVTPCIRACALIGAGCRQKAQKTSLVFNVLLMCSMCFLWQILSFYYFINEWPASDCPSASLTIPTNSSASKGFWRYANRSEER